MPVSLGRIGPVSLCSASSGSRHTVGLGWGWPSGSDARLPIQDPLLSPPRHQVRQLTRWAPDLLAVGMGPELAYRMGRASAFSGTLALSFHSHGGILRGTVVRKLHKPIPRCRRSSARHTWDRMLARSSDQTGQRFEVAPACANFRDAFDGAGFSPVVGDHVAFNPRAGRRPHQQPGIFDRH